MEPTRPTAYRKYGFKLDSGARSWHYFYAVSLTPRSEPTYYNESLNRDNHRTNLKAILLYLKENIAGKCVLVRQGKCWRKKHCEWVNDQG